MVTIFVATFITNFVATCGCDYFVTTNVALSSPQSKSKTGFEPRFVALDKKVLRVDAYFREGKFIFISSI